MLGPALVLALVPVLVPALVLVPVLVPVPVPVLVLALELVPAQEARLVEVAHPRHLKALQGPALRHQHQVPMTLPAMPGPILARRAVVLAPELVLALELGPGLAPGPGPGLGLGLHSTT